MSKQLALTQQTSLPINGKGWFVAFHILLNTTAFSQTNLVPNPSFEDYTSCPSGLHWLDKVLLWYNPTLSSPDYYNTCDTGPESDNAGVPNNCLGFQQARTGVAYTGIAAVSNAIGSNTREYVGIKLSEPLKKGKRYSVEYYLSLSDSSRNATDAMGAYLSKDSLTKFYETGVPYILILDAKPQIQNAIGSVLKDKINWTRIGGVYKAEGGEQFLTIGNFIYDSFNTMEMVGPGQGTVSYYYIDDVSVTCLNCDSTGPENNLFIPDAFSPNGDDNNDVLFVRGNNIKTLHIAVYDRWGEKVFESNDQSVGWDGTYKGKELNSAVFVYYCSYKYLDQGEFRQKGDITLIR